MVMGIFGELQGVIDLFDIIDPESADPHRISESTDTLTDA